MSDGLAWLSTQQLEMESLLRELVEISSHTPNLPGNTAVADRLATATLALAPSLTGGVVASPSGKYGAHLHLSSPASGAPVLLIGHHDTVFPVETFAGFREDGALLRGPGVLDMKGGLVVIAFALGALERAGLLGRVPLQLLSVSDEEIGSPEGRVLIDAVSPGAAASLVFESGRSEDQIITRRKGTGSVVCKARGRAAHAGNNHKDGHNAIWALARFIDAAQQLTDYERGRTVNVGKVTGGIGKNTVPESAEAHLDIRFLSAEDGESLVKDLDRAAQAAAGSVAGTSLQLEGGVMRWPLERTEASAALAARYGQHAAQEGLGSKESVLLGGGSDANTTARHGVPSIDGLGPRGKGFHTTDEYIERSTLIPKARALYRMLASFAAD